MSSHCKPLAINRCSTAVYSSIEHQVRHFVSLFSKTTKDFHYVFNWGHLGPSTDTLEFAISFDHALDFIRTTRRQSTVAMGCLMFNSDIVYLFQYSQRVDVC